LTRLIQTVLAGLARCAAAWNVVGHAAEQNGVQVVAEGTGQIDAAAGLCAVLHAEVARRSHAVVVVALWDADLATRAAIRETGVVHTGRLIGGEGVPTVAHALGFVRGLHGAEGVGGARIGCARVAENTEGAVGVAVVGRVALALRDGIVHDAAVGVGGTRVGSAWVLGDALQAVSGALEAGQTRALVRVGAVVA